ncbi:UNVERIFIED_ORG: hypothetical protein QFZ59_004140 [Bacillus sp. B2I3]|nr:hypothetical protein [Bacillus sp. B2I3]
MKKAKIANITENADLKKEITFPLIFEEFLEETIVKVEAPYQIIEEGGRRYITASWYVKSGETGLENREKMLKDIVSREYNPFLEENLYEKVARVNLSDEESILSFCNRYGPIGTIDEKMPMNVAGNTQKTIIGTGAPLEAFIEEARLINSILKHHYDLKSDKLRLSKEVKDKYIETIIFFYPELNDRLSTGDDKTIVKAWIMLLINRRLPLISPYLKLGNDNSFIQTVTSYSLLGAIYHQLKELVANEHSLKECLFCGSYFTPRRIDATFCPPDIPGDIGSCKNNYNQLKLRARKWYFSGQKSIDEISKFYGKSKQEIQQWMEDYKGKKQRKLKEE